MVNPETRSSTLFLLQLTHCLAQGHTVEECSSVSYKLVHFRRHGPVAEHYGLGSGISRIWLENQGQALLKQYVLLIESVIFVQLSLNLDKEEDNRGFKSNWRATNKAFAAKNLLGSHEVSLGVQQTAADSDAGNSLRVCSCRKPGWWLCRNSHGAFTILLLPLLHCYL